VYKVGSYGKYKFIGGSNCQGKRKEVGSDADRREKVEETPPDEEKPDPEFTGEPS